MHELDEQVAAARGKELARIGVRPRPWDLDATIIYLIGSRAYFRANPVRFDQVFSSSQVGTNPIHFDFPTEQTVGVINDQPTIQITLPDISAVERIADVKGIVEKLVFVASWLLTRRLNTLLVNHIILQIQVQRLKRARLAATDAFTATKRTRATIRAARLSRKVDRRAATQALKIKRFKSARRFIFKLAARAVIRVFLIVGLIIDTIIIIDAVVRGAQRAGLPGAIGAFAGGVADAATFGLLTPTTELLAMNVEQGLRDDPIKATRFFGLGGRI